MEKEPGHVLFSEVDSEVHFRVLNGIYEGFWKGTLRIPSGYHKGSINIVYRCYSGRFRVL